MPLGLIIDDREEHLAQGIDSPFTRILEGMKNLRSSLRANWNENGIFISVSGNPSAQMAVVWCGGAAIIMFMALVQ